MKIVQKMNHFFNRFLNLFNLEIIRTHPKEAIKFARDYFEGKRIIACEIGVFKGENSEQILKNLNIKKIYLIDPYERYEEYKLDKNYGNLVSAKKDSKKRLRKFSNKITWIEKYSEKAIKEIQEKLDFIYIDGNHEYKYVKKDLELYWPTLKKGGIFSGHDIQYLGVSKALLEFAKKKNLEVHFGDRRDWWIVKNE